jgi:hypothetical protein
VRGPGSKWRFCRGDGLIDVRLAVILVCGSLLSGTEENFLFEGVFGSSGLIFSPATNLVIFEFNLVRL